MNACKPWGPIATGFFAVGPECMCMYTCIDLDIYIYIHTSIHMYIYTHCPDGSNLSELGRIEITPGIDLKWFLNIFGVVTNGLEWLEIILKSFKIIRNHNKLPGMDLNWF